MMASHLDMALIAGCTCYAILQAVTDAKGTPILGLDVWEHGEHRCTLSLLPLATCASFCIIMASDCWH